MSDVSPLSDDRPPSTTPTTHELTPAKKWWHRHADVVTAHRLYVSPGRRFLHTLLSTGASLVVTSAAAAAAVLAGIHGVRVVAGEAQAATTTSAIADDFEKFRNNERQDAHHGQPLARLVNAYKDLSRLPSQVLNDLLAGYNGGERPMSDGAARITVGALYALDWAVEFLAASQIRARARVHRGDRSIQYLLDGGADLLEFEGLRIVDGKLMVGMVNKSAVALDDLGIEITEPGDETSGPKTYRFSVGSNHKGLRPGQRCNVVIDDEEFQPDDLSLCKVAGIILVIDSWMIAYRVIEDGSLRPASPPISLVEFQRQLTAHADPVMAL